MQTFGRSQADIEATTGQARSWMSGLASRPAAPESSHEQAG
jgi:hypothetical protein